MRRTKKKLEARPRRIAQTDPIEELRRLKEEELRHAQGGCQLDVRDCGCT